MVRINTFFIIAFGLDNAILSYVHVVEYEVPEVQSRTKGIQDRRVVRERSFPLVASRVVEVVVCEIEKKLTDWIFYIFLFVVQCKTFKPKCPTNVESLSLSVVTVVSFYSYVPGFIVP